MEGLRLNLLLVLFACQLLFLLPVSSSSTPIDPDGEEADRKVFSETMLSLGRIQGKAYYAESKLLMSHSNAAAYCESFGMKLASFENQEEFDFAQRALAGLKLVRLFWTSGRESQRPSMFVWNETGLPLEDDNSYIPRWGMTINDDYYCIVIFRWSDADNGLGAEPCTTPYRPICQT